MKKIISNAVLLILMTLISCQNEELVQSEQKGNYALKVERNFGSRTQADEEGNVTWSKGDKILVYGENVEGVLTLQGEGGESTGIFSGYVFGNPDNLKWAIYPSDESKTTEKGAEINLSQITYPYSNSPMVGEIGDNNNVQLEHLCALIRIPVENIPANAKMVLSSSDIAGTAEWDGNSLTVTNPTNDIEVKIPTGGNFYVDMPVFATPTETEKTFTLTIDGVSCGFKSSVAVKKLTRNANLIFKCKVENGKVTGITKEETSTEQTSYYLPDGPSFNSIVGAYLQKNASLTKIKFVANSKTTSEDILTTDENGTKGYLVANGEWLEIHTLADEFMVNWNCSSMFSGVGENEILLFKRLKAINFGSKFNTSNVYYTYYMFASCVALENLDVSKFNTSNVLEMEGMFWECNNLSKLDLSSFDTSKATNMRGMFMGCKKLTSLSLGNFKTSNVTNMEVMFYNCNMIQSIDVQSFNTSKVTNMHGMFAFCDNLKTLDVSRFDTKNVTDMGWMFARCQKLSMINVSGFNTENVTDMGHFFGSCRELVLLDVSKFNTLNVTNMSGMFSGCGNLDVLDVDNFNTQEVTDMSSMFSGCKNIKFLAVKKFNTSKVSNMSFMFSDCGNLTTLDLSNFNTENVTDMSCMFESCTNLTSVDLKSFNTKNVICMSLMFNGCNNITSLDLSNFNTTKVTHMNGMFNSCKNLETLNLNSFNTERLTDMNAMFNGCCNLTSLDLSVFSFINLPEVTNMLGNVGVPSLDVLTPIKVSEEGYKYLTETTKDCGIGKYAKFVKSDGTDW